MNYLLRDRLRTPLLRALYRDEIEHLHPEKKQTIDQDSHSRYIWNAYLLLHRRTNGSFDANCIVLRKCLEKIRNFNKLIFSRIYFSRVKIEALKKCLAAIVILVIHKGQVLTHYYRLMNKSGGYTWLQTCATVVCNSKNAEEQNIICVNYIIR